MPITERRIKYFERGTEWVDDLSQVFGEPEHVSLRSHQEGVFYWFPDSDGGVSISRVAEFSQPLFRVHVWLEGGETESEPNVPEIRVGEGWIDVYKLGKDGEAVEFAFRLHRSGDIAYEQIDD